jgi:hypothetical protein
MFKSMLCYLYCSLVYGINQITLKIGVRGHLIPSSHSQIFDFQMNKSGKYNKLSFVLWANSPTSIIYCIT